MRQLVFMWPLNIEATHQSIIICIKPIQIGKCSCWTQHQDTLCPNQSAENDQFEIRRSLRLKRDQVEIRWRIAVFLHVFLLSAWQVTTINRVTPGNACICRSIHRNNKIIIDFCQYYDRVNRIREGNRDQWKLSSRTDGVDRSLESCTERP